MEKARSQAAVVHCIDPRFRIHVERLIAEELGIGIAEMTVTTVAGGVRDIAERLPGRGLIRCGCEVATLGHGANTAILVNHQDCTAYGGSGKFKNLVDEIKFHEGELMKAVEYLTRKQLPAKEIRGYFAELNGHVTLRRLF